MVDRTFENPATSGGLLVMALTAAAIASNALFLQNGRHPGPLFTTRSVPPVAATRAPAPEATAGVAAVPEAATRVAAIENPPMPRLAPRAAGEADGTPLVEKETDLTPPMPVTEAPSEAPVAVSRGDDLIVEIQRELARIGLYRDAIDGVVGPNTESAIRAFETASGIMVTGAPSRDLLAALRQPLPPSETRSIAVSSTEAAALNRRERERAESIAAEERRLEEIRLRETYKVIQAALNRIGYGPIPVDGAAGPATLDAIRRFELDNGMPITGAAGDAIVARLYAIGAIKPG